MNRRLFDANKAGQIAAIGLLVALMTTACGGGNSAGSTAADSTQALSTAPDSARVDLEEPTFSDPTTITNPLFPIADLTQVVQIGSDADGSLRQEVTLLPGTKMIQWNGQQIETVTSQFMAYSAGRILEVAVDFFAQADDGSVWYFGEDVTTYQDGVVADHDGSWLAGKDGPPGMIMPADPQVGDVYRPENIPGLVFEEVVVKSIGETVDGPQGPVSGCLLVEEHPMDGAIEDKTFAPGYGEFHALVESENEEVTVSVGVPTDALGGGGPAELGAISSDAVALLAPISDWQATGASVASLSSAWDGYRSTATPLTAGQIDQALQDLRAGVATQDDAVTHSAAVDLAFAVTDLRLRYAEPAAIDLDRMDILAQRVVLDAADSDTGRVAGDLAALQAVWSRVAHTAADTSSVENALQSMSDAVDASDQTAAATAADQLRGALAAL